ncbi:MAG: acyl carrier protein [Clostridia bacterium]|nr:acyl carrier protein [Clostridia bacterium]MBQ7224665.1 acyl carrier protein [Clostridia bacterium]MBR6774065.1 acyl carrier protein [Clostridia bacterium]MBR7141267.1 acyl carrier protein [Clostridia bacterium]
MDILAQLNEIAQEYRGEGNLNRGDSFTDLGFDSLDKVELVMAIEEKFDITFPDDVKVDTVDELIAMIEELTK